ncbi:MAG: DMT family transporter, partial [Leptolyngbyaceae bacterium]|nr:DMT family transporter [Leptolyngbyaceae bacterium]
IITVPLAWLFFGDRPSPLRIGVMVAICLGVILAAFPNLVTAGNISVLGVAAAVVSGIAFAFYLIFMQLGFQKLHPVPVSLIQFSTIFVLSSISLMAPLPAALSAQVSPENRPGIIVGGIILGILTLIGYLFNNFGVRFMGAARASIIASSGPVMTALLAFLIIPGKGTALQQIQIIGILVVTFAVSAMNFEKMQGQAKAAKAAK